MSSPNVLRAVFAEIGKKAENDSFFVLNYDGEFSTHHHYAVAGPSEGAESAMIEKLSAHDDKPDLKTALERAREAWCAGMSGRSGEDEDGENSPESADPLEEALKTGHLEAAVLERDTPRESKFRLLLPQELNF